MDKYLEPYFDRLAEKANETYNSVLDLEYPIFHTDNPLKDVYEKFTHSYSPYPNTPYNNYTHQLIKISRTDYILFKNHFAPKS